MDVEQVLGRMTLEEKAGMCSGQDFWHLKSVERLGIPPVMVCDGPHGLRKQDQSADHLGINDSVPAVCFPTACATACSFDRELLQELGSALGEECQAEEIAVILGPAVNIKRSPLCGRNFEYFSEDPLLASEMAKHHILGVQSRQVGASLKHFAANNQEYRRMTCSSEVDERTLREIYLAAFEGAVREARPWTVMCSYNRVNGEYAGESRRLLTEILREEWGFDGYVMSDWGAVNDRVEALKAGMELEMPASGGVTDREIVAAVRDGVLEESVLDEAVRRILEKVFAFWENRRPGAYSQEEHHRLARRIETESAVLLKNDGGLLPLRASQKVAFLGLFAKEPRFQGGGSSHINSCQVTSAVDAMPGVPYAQGYTLEDRPDEALLGEAVELARDSDVAVIFAGLPDALESEGYDRSHMGMPDNQNQLIAAVAAAQPNTVVVLHNGSPVEMPWVDRVGAVLEMYLGGQAVGGSAVDLLYGRANPCGKLAETFPLRLEDNPSHPYFPGDGRRAEYREGVFVGYRYYQAKRQPVLFPFGHGLSYTTFAYSGLTLSARSLRDTDTLEVSFRVKNTGPVAGKEIAQLYVADKTGAALRPVMELRNFAKVALEPGEEKTVTMELSKRAWSWYSEDLRDWTAATGEYEILVASSSEQVRLSDTVHLIATAPQAKAVDRNTVFGDLLGDSRAAPILAPCLDAIRKSMSGGTEASGEAISEDMMREMLANFPLRAVRSFAPDIDLDGFVAQLRQALQ